MTNDLSWRTALGALGVLAALLTFAPSASAQQAKRKVVKIDEITVEGRIQKPQAFYILQRSNLNYEGLNKVESFLKRIPESVRTEPF